MEQALGEGGDQLHEWIFGLASFRERHGLSGGDTRDADDDVLRETLDAAGAVVMGRRMFSSGEGPWDDDPKSGGWWGDDPPFDVPVFVLTPPCPRGRGARHLRHRRGRSRARAGESRRGRQERFVR